MDIPITLLLPDDARWISGEILYLYLHLNKGSQDETSCDFIPI